VEGGSNDGYQALERRVRTRRLIELKWANGPHDRKPYLIPKNEVIQVQETPSNRGKREQIPPQTEEERKKESRRRGV